MLINVSINSSDLYGRLGTDREKERERERVEERKRMKEKENKRGGGIESELIYVVMESHHK